MKVVIFGFYNQGNIGDTLFIEAFQHLFPDLDLHFTDHLDVKQLDEADAVFFGGGSFLLDPPKMTGPLLPTMRRLLDKPLFYLGVGVEADIHPVHLKLMQHARLIATRSRDQVERLQSINPQVKFVPDLVYALRSHVRPQVRKDKSVLILPNIMVVPQGFEPHWKHAAWSYFKSEFSQFMDWLIEHEYDISLLSMCNGAEYSDQWAATQLIGLMKYRAQKYLLPTPQPNISQIIDLFSRYSVVITQRFHGIVLAEMTDTPYIAIHHHDKIKLTYPNRGNFVSYYNLSKHSLIEAVNSAANKKCDQDMPIEPNVFEALRDEVISLLK